MGSSLSTSASSFGRRDADSVAGGARLMPSCTEGYSGEGTTATGRSPPGVLLEPAQIREASRHAPPRRAPLAKAAGRTTQRRDAIHELVGKLARRRLARGALHRNRSRLLTRRAAATRGKARGRLQDDDR